VTWSTRPPPSRRSVSAFAQSSVHVLDASWSSQSASPFLRGAVTLCGEGKVIFRRQLKRRYVLPFFQKLPPCLVGIEACASSHYWSCELQALGHTVRLMPAAYVSHTSSDTRVAGSSHAMPYCSSRVSPCLVVQKAAPRSGRGSWDRTNEGRVSEVRTTDETIITAREICETDTQPEVGHASR
jgi:hypothetical protein